MRTSRLWSIVAATLRIGWTMGGLVIGIVAFDAVAQASDGFGDSPVFAVDLRGLTGGLAVKGRILDAALHQALNGVSVTLAGQNATTLADGSYSFANVSLASGNSLNVSLSGYTTASQTIAPLPGTSVVTEPDLLLQPIPPGNQPVVTSVIHVGP
jgi:hypothetical protein